MKPIFIFCSIFILISCHSIDDQVQADRLLGKDRLTTLENFLEPLQKGSVPLRKGSSGEGLRFKEFLPNLRKLFLNARTKQDVYYALLALNSSMTDSHSKLKGLEHFAPQQQFLQLGFKLRIVATPSGRPKFVVAESHLPEVKKGYVFKTWDGLTFEQLYNKYSSWSRGHSKAANLVFFSRWLTFRDSKKHPFPASKVGNFQFFSPSQKQIVNLKLKWQTVAELDLYDKEDCPGDRLFLKDEYASWPLIFKGLRFCVYDVGDKDTVAIRYHSFYYRKSREWYHDIAPKISYTLHLNPSTQLKELGELQDFIALKDFLKKRVPKKVILDLRENLGGNTLFDIVSLFAKTTFRTTGKKLILTPYVLENRDFAEKAVKNFENRPNEKIMNALSSGKEPPNEPFYCKKGPCRPSDFFREPYNLKVKPELHVISGPMCVSACDQFLAILKDNHIGHLYGENPRGSSAVYRAPKTFYLKEGTPFSLTITASSTTRPNGKDILRNPAKVQTHLQMGDNWLLQVLRILANSQKIDK